MSNRFDEQIDLTRFAAGALVNVCEDETATEDARAAAVQHLEMTLEELSIASEELEQRLLDLDAVTAAADRERQRYERLFADSPVASVVTDRVGIVHEINQRAVELFETTIEYAIGRPLSAFIGRTSRRDFRGRLASVDRGTEPQAWRLHIRRSLGHDEMVVDCELHRTVDLGESRSGYRWAFRDAGETPERVASPTAENVEREALERRTDGLEVDLAFHRVVSAAMTHDLRSPLAIISGLAAALAERADRAPQRDDLIEAIGWQSGRALRLIDDLLELQSGQLELQTEGVVEDLGAMIEAVVDEVGSRDHEIVVSGVADARVDHKVLRRIVANLVGNAVKMSPKSTRIDVRTWRAAGGLLLAVEDRGPGFGQGAGGHVFEPFSRLDRDAALPGWGLGLSIVAELARLHGGAAWVVDRSGGGGAVHVYLRSLPLAGDAS